eukprot:950787-Pyramimonas_sp.AAC.1
MWSSKPGAIHRHVKQPQALEWGALDSAGNMTTDNKHTLLQTSATEWNAMWRGPVDSPANFKYMMGRCVQAAKDDPFPPISLQDVDAVLPVLPAKKARGADVLSP